jgi:hypothetical protein
VSTGPTPVATRGSLGARTPSPSLMDALRFSATSVSGGREEVKKGGDKARMGGRQGRVYGHTP